MTPSETPCFLDLQQLKDLLRDLSDQRADISIRLQLDGRSWLEHFSSVLVFSRHTLLLVHMPTRTVVNIHDLNRVSGFIIDQPYRSVVPFQRYVIDPLCERLKKKSDGLLHA